MAVANAAGRAFESEVVLPGAQARYLRRAREHFETPSDYMPRPQYLFMHEVVRMDSYLLYQWAEHFVRETEHLHRSE